MALYFDRITGQFKGSDDWYGKSMTAYISECEYAWQGYKPTNKKSIMSNIANTIKMALKSEPEKSLIKAGIFDECENLTCEGKEVMWIILQNEYKDKLKEKADIILAEKEKNK
jgi:hypothetical protein